ncbi:Mur ligase family protein [Cytobacillus sp. Hz8]|uniref:Mur ligase family protein n=1 Tax=Cytobacillus sp. Hz8 TaxID=3347168 RepID=UPI0035D7FDCA
MKHLPLNEIVQQIQGRIVWGSNNPIIKHVIKWTNKEIKDHTLLFHLRKDQINGKYWRDNEEIAVVTESPEQCQELGNNIVLVVVDDVQEAYYRFIDYYRSLFDIPIIGVTGTCGKTTTKEMIATILEAEFETESTWMSMNSMSVNLRYLLRLDDETEAAVYEMPVAYPGYLRIACRYFKPQIRILLNIGIHHLADSETPEAYMKAKGEIVDGLDPVKGILILNQDDENIEKIIDVTPFQNVVYFGKKESAHFHATEIRYAKQGMEFTLCHENSSYEVFVPGLGEHNVYNAMAAIAATSFVGIDIEKAISRLAQFEQIEEHLEFKKGVNGCTVIDDTWNSAPLSMETGLQVLKDVSKQLTSIAFLGYMPQLGDSHYAVEQYQKIGEKAVETGVDWLIVVGDEAKPIGHRALELGMDKNKVYFCEEGMDIYEIIKDQLNEETVLLLKITHRVMVRSDFIKLKNWLLPIDKN